MGLTDCDGGLIQSIKNVHARGVILLPGGGQAEAPGVAVDQPRAELGFQLLQLPGDGRVRGVESLGGGAEAATLDDATKRTHGQQLIH